MTASLVECRSPIAGPTREPEHPGRRLAKRLLRAYLRAWHGFRQEGMEALPPGGPALVLTNHVSVLDIAVLMASDPYPNTAFVLKASMVGLPLIGRLVGLWGPIPVERDGRDAEGVRAILRALRDGRVVAIAAEGTRSRDGRLGVVNPVLARLAVRGGVPIVPVGISGSFAALPPGARLPRRRPITLRVGAPFVLPPDTGPDAAAARIRAAIAVLLPGSQQPAEVIGPSYAERA